MAASIESPTAAKVRNGAVLLVAGRITAAACGFIQLPIVLQGLGAERFGIWITLCGVLWTLAGFDFGLGFALQNQVGRALAHDRFEAAAALVRRWRRLLLRLALAAAVPTIALAIWGGWLDWFDLPPSARTEVRVSTAVVAGAIVLSLPASFAVRLAAAAQLTWLNGLWTAAASLVSLSLVAISASFDLGLPAFTAAACMLALLPALGVAAVLHRRFSWLRQRDDGTVLPRGLWRESALFFLPQFGASFITSFTPVLVALFAGPLVAGGFGVLQRLYGFPLQLHSLCLQPAWPAYTHAAALNDHTGARHLYQRSWVITLFVAAAVMLLAPLTENIIGFWLRGEMPPVSRALIWAVAAWHTLQLAGQPPAMLLNGTGRQNVTAWSTIACICLTVLLSAWTGPAWGAVGVVGALALPYAAVNLPVVLQAAHGALRDMQTARSVP